MNQSDIGPSRSSVRPPDAMDVGQLWATLRDGRGTILRVAVGFFVAVAVITLGSRMSFKARARLYLGELEGQPSAAAGELNLSNADPSGLASETEILQSDSLVTRAILASGLNVTLAPEGWRAPRYFEWLLDKRDPKLVDVTVPEIAAVNASLGDDYRGPRTYKVVFTSATEYELWTTRPRFSLTADDPHLLGRGHLNEPIKTGGVNLTLTQGTAHGPRAHARYDLTVRPIDEVVTSAGKLLGVSFPKAVGQREITKVVALEFADNSPHQAASFLRELIRGYLEAHQSWKVEDATAAEAFVSTQLGVVREALDKTEKKLADYRSNTRVVVLDNEARAMIEQIGKYEEQRVAARLQVAALSEMKQALKNPNARMEAFLMGEGDDTVLENLASSLSKARQDLATLEQKYNSGAPDVRQQRAQVDTQLDMIRNYVTNRLTRAQGNLASLGQVVSQYEEKLKTVPGAEVGLAQLARESEVYSKIYSYLLERQQQTAIVKASRVSKNRVLDAPEEPYRADSPQPLTRLAVSLFGLFLGCAFVVLRRAFSPCLQSAAEVSGGLPVLASVPWRAGPTAYDLLVAERTSSFADAFRMLRTNLYYSQTGSYQTGVGGRVVLITSPSARDGKTTTTLGLAGLLTADRKTVLVIDADLRKPTHHAWLKQPQSPGLGNVLAGQHEWFNTLRSPAPGVHTLAAGVASSSDLLSSETLASMLIEARAMFDFVLIDAPSFPLVPDALMLCEHVDYVLSVVRLQNTPRKLAAEHIERLAALCGGYGLVVNGVGVSVASTSGGDAAKKPRKQAPAPVAISSAES